MHAWFAALPAIGAFWLVQGFLVRIALVLISVGVFHRESGPPRTEPTLLPVAFVGAFVAVRLGGWRGFLGLLAFASVPLIRFLSYPVGAAIECSHWYVDSCRGVTDFDFVLPQAWLVPGFAAGVLAAVVTRIRVPLRVELEALAPIALVELLMAYVLPIAGGYPAPSALEVILMFVGLLTAAYILTRRSSNPRRSALIVAAGLLLLNVPWDIFELWLNTAPDAGLWDLWLSVLGPAVLFIATHALSSLPPTLSRAT